VNKKQEPYCGKFTTIDEYILAQLPEIQPILKKARSVIKEHAPKATEKMSWNMPTFWQGKNLIHFAASKKHLGIYPGDLTSTPFISKLKNYTHSKGAIQFPYDKPIDYDFITKIVKYKIKMLES